jgi:hypothetical protein
MAVSRGALAVIVISVAAAGAVVRILSGNAVLHTDLVYSPVQKESIPGAKSPESTAKSFYMYIDSGQYDEAYDISLEPEWGQGTVSYDGEVRVDFSRFSGWTSREAFVERMKRELEPNGSGIRLNNIQVGDAEPTGDAVAYAGVRADAQADPGFPWFSIAHLEGTYRVPVSGHMLGACSIFRWEKNLTVVEIAGKYRVLLDGTKGARAFFYQSWFENIKKLRNIRVGGIDQILR